MSDTPRTDAAVKALDYTEEMVGSAFARTLERELAAVTIQAKYGVKNAIDGQLLDQRRMDNAALLKDYEEALAERNKAWSKADEIERDNASRITRDQYREHEVKKLTADNAALREALESCVELLAPATDWDAAVEVVAQARAALAKKD